MKGWLSCKPACIQGLRWRAPTTPPHQQRIARQRQVPHQGQRQQEGWEEQQHAAGAQKEAPNVLEASKGARRRQALQGGWGRGGEGRRGADGAGAARGWDGSVTCSAQALEAWHRRRCKPSRPWLTARIDTIAVGLRVVGTARKMKRVAAMIGVAQRAKKRGAPSGTTAAPSSRINPDQGSRSLCFTIDTHSCRQPAIRPAKICTRLRLPVKRAAGRGSGRGGTTSPSRRRARSSSSATAQQVVIRQDQDEDADPLKQALRKRLNAWRELIPHGAPHSPSE